MSHEPQSERVARIKDFLKSRTNVPFDADAIGTATGVARAMIDQHRSLSADPQIVRERTIPEHQVEHLVERSSGERVLPGVRSRHLSRQIERGQLSTRCSAAQRHAAQCERRFSAARASRVIRRAGRSDPPLRCLRQLRGWPRGGGRSCPPHARTAADRAQQLRANLFTISDAIWGGNRRVESKHVPAREVGYVSRVR
jgi:hypothetical protein